MQKKWLQGCVNTCGDLIRLYASVSVSSIHFMDARLREHDNYSGYKFLVAIISRAGVRSPSLEMRRGASTRIMSKFNPRYNSRIRSVA